jgi:hypothetical protein
MVRPGTDDTQHLLPKRRIGTREPSLAVFLRPPTGFAAGTPPVRGRRPVEQLPPPHYHRGQVIRWGQVIMQRSPAIFLQAVIVLVGLGAVALLLWEPHVEGRNVHATVFQVYFNDPFLACAYLASIPFFVALYQAFMLLGHIRRDRVFSPSSVKALRTIKYCAISLIAFLFVAQSYFFLFMRGQDDIAGGMAICFFLIGVFAVVAAAASVLETTLQNTFDIRAGQA